MKKKIIITLLIILALLTITLLYAKFITSRTIKVEEEAIIDNNLPNNFHGLKIVQISDVHYGKLINKNMLIKTVNKINEIKPDIVIFTGDFFSKDIKVKDKEIIEINKIIGKINVKYEKYAIIGDEDTNNKDKFYQIFDQNFIILDNEEEYLYLNSDTPIRIIGINNIKNEPTYEDNLYSILLLHKPDETLKLKNNYNIIYSGHSMGGQINLPFYGPLIKLNGAKTYISGNYTIDKDTSLYVSNGLGTKNISLRVNNKPIINLYRLYSK